MTTISITAEIPEPLYKLATQTVKDCPHLSHDRLIAEAITLYIRLQQQGKSEAQADGII
ncbi:DUF2811 domain-containing protein [Leptolyngbya sp. NK1-12]|uniref:DUF2811 domain-containing protein n=1 Tax=Leptolyngbya sp. NK1-12 TaxID=2547451 RepID=A0AA96WI57_9CYAN|nr:hypothetical protein [Leptolyngbya sp. NK1-12]WNZ22716.1 DUF2811 domain-containing protein [Leptolyngbya sp. NK1-12]